MAIPDLASIITPSSEGRAAEPRRTSTDLSQIITPSSEGRAAEPRRTDVDLRQFASPQDGRGLANEFASGFSGGIDNLQMTLFGVAGLTGRELGIKTLEDFGIAGAERNLIEASNSGRESKGFSDIESAGGFFKWAAASLGEALPSLGLAMAGGGIGGILGKKVVELGIRKTLARQVFNNLTKKGFGADEAAEGALRFMSSRAGERMLAGASVRGKTTAEAIASGFNKGAAFGAAGASTPPQVGSIDLELQEAGIDAGLTALMGGAVGGALEAFPAIRLLDKLFPGVDTAVSKTFVKDFAISMGQQNLIEGSTEAAQEMIQIAALAYHDPSFDLSDAGNARRVVDAFAAGAIVGTVTGGAASLAGNATRPSPRKIEKPPVLEEFAIEEDSDFDPADNTVFQEVRSRVMGAVSAMVDPAINSMNATANKIFTALDSDMGGGMNQEAVKLSQVLNDAHNKFIETHSEDISNLREWVRDRIDDITTEAELLKDPEVRETYIEDALDRVRDGAEGLVNKIKESAARRDQQTSAEVDNMDFTPEDLAALGFNTADTTEQTESLREVAPEDEVVAEPGETDAPPITIFGLNQKQPRVGVAGEETVQGYDENSLEKGLDNLSRKFPDANEDSFRIITQEDGTFLIEVIDPNLRDDLKFWNDFDAARASGRKKRDSNLAIEIEGVDGHSFGYGFKKFIIDVQQMAYKGLNLVSKAEQRGQMTMEQGFLTFAGELLSRGVINNEQFEQLNKRAKIVLKKSKDDPIPQFSDPPQFTSREGAERVKNEFIAHLKSLGFTLPRNLFVVSKQADNSLWTFGFNQENPTAMRRFQTKYGNKFMQFKEELRKFRGDARRRSDTLDQAIQDENAFSGNATNLGAPSTQSRRDPGGQRTLPLQNRADRTREVGSGDLGDTTGVTAGDPDVTVGPTFGQRQAIDPDTGRPTGDPFQESRDTRAQTQDGDQSANVVGITPEGQTDFAILPVENSGFGGRPDNNVNQQVAPSLEESRESQQGTDPATDPKNQPSDFEERHKRSGGGTGKGASGSTRSTSNATTKYGKQTKEEAALLKRWARGGTVKILFGDFATDGAATKLVSDITNFVTKTLGLSNQITVMDDTGLRLLIETGAVSDPVFTETLNDPNVHARNIRIGDNSFIYLSPKILSDPATTTVALGHELGHHVYRVAWDNLTPAAQQRLKDAYMGIKNKGTIKPRTKHTEAQAKVDRLKAERAAIVADPFLTKEQQEALVDLTKEEKSAKTRLANIDKQIAAAEKALSKISPTITQRGTKATQEFDEAGFNEWMADQLAAWIVAPRLPSNPVESFFAKVGGQIRRLYDFINSSKRFQLNETFKQFADAIALKAANPQDATANPFNDAQIKAWFKNEGVTMYGWFGPTMAGKDQGRSGSQKQLEQKLHAVRLKINSIFTTPNNERAFQTSDPADLQVFKGDYRKLAAQEEQLKQQIKREQKSSSDRASNRRSRMRVEVDNMAYDFAPVTAEGKKALARIRKKYPAVAKRAVTLRNWMTRAYALALAPSTSVIRAMPYKSAQKLVRIFNRQEQGAARKGQNYPQAVRLMSHQFANRYVALTEGMTDVGKRKLAKSLQKKDGDPDATFTKREQKIRDLFDEMHEYATDAGLPVNRVTNYWPRTYDRDLLIAGKAEIIAHLMANRHKGDTLSTVQGRYNRLIDPNANEGRATRDATETPGFNAMNSRAVMAPFFDQFLDSNPDVVVTNYINQLVKRVEFNTRLGSKWTAGNMDIKRAIRDGAWDPKAEMHNILGLARADGATDEEISTMEKYIDANLGQLGRDDISPGTRKFIAGVMAYQNMRVLMFTVFASLPDGVGPAIRAGSMRLHFNAIKNNFHDIMHDTGKLSEMSRAFGIVSDAATEHIMMEYVDNHHMPPVMRKWNENFFKYTGLNWYTNFTRRMALATGIDYIQQSYEQTLSKDARTKARGKDMLAELGMTVENAEAWIKAGKPTYDSQSHDMTGPERKAAEALIQFVDESLELLFRRRVF